MWDYQNDVMIAQFAVYMAGRTGENNDGSSSVLKAGSVQKVGTGVVEIPLIDRICSSSALLA
jgi:hypothetical protein